jgi:hypothetical protein
MELLHGLDDRCSAREPPQGKDGNKRDLRAGVEL